MNDPRALERARQELGTAFVPFLRLVEQARQGDGVLLGPHGTDQLTFRILRSMFELEEGSKDVRGRYQGDREAERLVARMRCAGPPPRKGALPMSSRYLLVVESCRRRFLRLRVPKEWLAFVAPAGKPIAGVTSAVRYPATQGREPERAGLDDSLSLPRIAGQRRSKRGYLMGIQLCTPRNGAEHAPRPNQDSNQQPNQDALKLVGSGSGTAYPASHGSVLQGRDPRDRESGSLNLGSPDFRGGVVEITCHDLIGQQPSLPMPTTTAVGIPVPIHAGTPHEVGAERAGEGPPAPQESCLVVPWRHDAGLEDLPTGTDHEGGSGPFKTGSQTDQLPHRTEASPRIAVTPQFGGDRSPLPSIEDKKRKVRQILEGIPEIPPSLLERAMSDAYVEGGTGAEPHWLDRIYPRLFLRCLQPLVEDLCLRERLRDREIEHIWEGKVVQRIPPKTSPSAIDHDPVRKSIKPERRHAMSHSFSDASERLAVADPDLHGQFLKEAENLKQDPKLAASVDKAFQEVCRTAMKKYAVGGQISNPGGYLRRTAERIQREFGAYEAGGQPPAGPLLSLNPCAGLMFAAGNGSMSAQDLTSASSEPTPLSGR